jgi:hypothetical protein
MRMKRKSYRRIGGTSKIGKESRDAVEVLVLARGNTEILLL